MAKLIIAMKCPQCQRYIFRVPGDWGTIKCPYCNWEWEMHLLKATEEQLRAHMEKNK